MIDAIADKKIQKPSQTQAWIAVAAYVATILIAVVGFYIVRNIGESSLAAATGGAQVAAEAASAVAAPAAAAPGHAKLHVIYHVLATLATLIIVGHVLGRLFRWVGQPPVIGEVVAGICLGPSLLGAINPAWMEMLIPSPAADPKGQVIASLQAVAQLGVLFYMFIVGLDLNAATIKKKAHTAVAISHMSIVLPFLLGAILALWLHPRYAPAGVNFTSFALFVGAAMSITAFPVLARILTDRGLAQSRLGSIALAAAAADDLTAWCLLAFVVGVLQSNLDQAAYSAMGSVAFILFVLFVVRPLAKRWCERLDATPGPFPGSAVVAGLAAVLLAGLTTDLIGIHAIFGAFMLGVVIPHDCRLAEEMKLRLNDLVTILLLPAFFALTGLRTEIGLVSGWENWLFCGVIIVVATLGKFGGTWVAARVTGSDWREASGLGILMNTRGLMELIVLDLGLQLGVISPTLFAMMVIMAIVTTVITSPVLLWLMKDGKLGEA